MYSAFEYLYRDAANYKAWGRVLLHGFPRPSEVDFLTSCLEDGMYFVAEQVGLPVLYETLYTVSGGQTKDDHAFHEFFAWQNVSHEGKEPLTTWGSVEDLLGAFRAAKNNWDVALSIHARRGTGATSAPA